MVDTTLENSAERRGEKSNSSALVIFRFFCNHDWRVLSETVTKSKYEAAIETARRNGATGKMNLPWQLCDGERKHIQTFCCDKCGSLKRFVEEI